MELEHSTIPKEENDHTDWNFSEFLNVFQDGCLVGGFNPFEKYSSKWKSSPSYGVKIKNM